MNLVENTEIGVEFRENPKYTCRYISVFTSLFVSQSLQPGVEIDMDYYIEKQIIPALDRFLGAVDNQLQISPDQFLQKARINEDNSNHDTLRIGLKFKL